MAIARKDVATGYGLAGRRVVWDWIKRLRIWRRSERKRGLPIQP